MVYRSFKFFMNYSYCYLKKKKFSFVENFVIPYNLDKKMSYIYTNYQAEIYSTKIKNLDGSWRTNLFI